MDKEKVKYEYEPRKYKWYDRVSGGICGDCGGKNIRKQRMYLPDLVLGGNTIIEIKGKFTARDRKIARGIKEQYPDLDFRFVFDKDNKLSKGSTTRYSEWCKDQGIPCSFKGVVPKEWLK